MAKSAKTANKVEGTSVDALIKEGKALGKMWSTLHNVRASTKANGFDTRLGKLLVELKAQSSLDSGQISRQVLTAHGIHNIDRRRRSEALWFVENEVACRAFMESSKKGFTSLTALQKAMRDVAKAEPSNVGQSDKPKQAKLVQQSETKVSVGPITRTKMVETIVKQCELNQLDLETIINDLQMQLAKQVKVAK
jgi:hypothetical protein